MTKSPVKAVLFDADGTLFDSKELIYSAYVHLADTYGYQRPSIDDVSRLLGKPIREIIKALFPAADVEKLFTTNSNFVNERAAHVLPYIGLKETLDELKSLNLKLGIVTSGGSKILTLIDHHQLMPYFDSIVHSERVKNHKPDPEGLLVAIKECNVEPRSTVMVGDMDVDIVAGKAAGCLATIALTHGYGNRQDLTLAGPDYIVDSLIELRAVISDLA